MIEDRILGTRSSIGLVTGMLVEDDDLKEGQLRSSVRSLAE